MQVFQELLDPSAVSLLPTFWGPAEKWKWPIKKGSPPRAKSMCDIFTSHWDLEVREEYPTYGEDSEVQ